MDCSSSVKSSYLASMISMLVACGGGGGSSGEQSSNSPDNSDENGKFAALERVAASTLDSEETVVLLAPGSLMDETYMPFTRLMANLNVALEVDMTGANRVDQAMPAKVAVNM